VERGTPRALRVVLVRDRVPLNAARRNAEGKIYNGMLDHDPMPCVHSGKSELDSWNE
jgi:hypothetical protein